MRRLKNPGRAAHFAGATDYEEACLVTVKCGPSVADLSYFRPDHAVVRQGTQSAQGAHGVLSESAYTFADGVDDGREVPAYSYPDADITDIAEYAKKQEAVVMREIEDAKSKQEIRLRAEKIRESQARTANAQKAEENAKAQ